MDGKGLAERLRAEIAQEVREIGDIGLATVLVGDDPASDIYVRRKHDAAQEVGIRSIDHRLPAETSQEELERLIGELNDDAGVDGILVQSPLPDQLDEEAAVRRLDPAKDVDGFHPENAARLYQGEPRFVPATPVGIMRLLQEYDVPLEGARAVVVGRSLIVGKPMSMLLLAANATVTTTHSRTVDLGAHTREADVLVVAVGPGRRGHRGHGQAGRDRRGRRHEPHGRRPARRRGSRRRRGRRAAHAGSGRRRPDDDRLAIEKYGRSLPAQALLRSRALVQLFGGSVPGPSFVVEGGTIA